MAQTTEPDKKEDRKSKVWIAWAGVLAVLLVFETAYLFHLQRHIKDMNRRKPLTYQEPVNAPALGSPFDSFFDSPQWDPFSELERMQEQMNRMFSHTMRRAGSLGNIVNPQGIHSPQAYFEPDLDIEDKKDHYLVRLDLPGLDKNQIKISVTENSLTVSGERKMEKEERPSDGYYRMERSYGSFYRQIPIPDDVKPEGVDAQYENGVLTIKLQKETAPPTEEKKAHKVQIQ